MLLKGVGVDTLSIGRHPLAPIKATILLRGPIALVAPSLKVKPRCPSQRTCAMRLRRPARAWSKAAAVPARIEPAAPLPFGSGAGVADACGDRSDNHIVEMDVLRSNCGSKMSQVTCVIVKVLFRARGVD